MGYYDQPQGTNGGNRSTSPIIALVSGVIGGLIVLFITPFLMKNGLFSSQQDNPNAANIIGPTTITSVKVNSNVIDAVKKAQPAVVGIVNLKRSDDPFNPEQIQQSAGSGIIYGKRNGKAYIVTNYHVIEGGSEIKVVISTGNNQNKEVNAKVLGNDPITDLSVLEINDKYMTAVAEFGNSDALTAGEPAIAIGNPLGLGQSVTVGVISSPKRSIDVNESMATDVIQTDAAINPGNSGGALVNISGQVIGINSLKIAESGVEGLGFAIPVNEARPIIDQLIKNGQVNRPYLGVRLVDLKQFPHYFWSETGLPSNVTSGVVIWDLEPGKPAHLAGLRSKDVIVALDGKTVTSSSELRKYLYNNKQIGDKVEVTYYRGSKKQTATLVLSEAPQNLER